MFKFLIVGLVVAVVVWLLLGRARRARRRVDEAESQRSGATRARMASCARCGLHLPETEALFDPQGRAYCGEEHRRLGAR